MTPAFGWEPSPAAARHDAGRLAEKTITAIRALLKDAGGDLAVQGATMLDRLRRNPQFCHPEVFHWYFQVRNGWLSGDEGLNRMMRLSQAIFDSRERAGRRAADIGVAIDTAPVGDGVAEALRHGAEYARRLAGEDVRLLPLREWSRDVTGRLKEALAMIRKFWPAAYQEMPLVVKKLIIYRGHAVIGFTDFRYHGSVFFKYEWLMKRKHLEEVAEDLIHEAAHVRLNSIMGATSLFRNDDREVYPSPLRRDLRSMYGVFHQMFVLRRVVEWYRRLDRKSLIGDRANLTENYGGLQQAHDVVRKHADLTPAGRQMMRTIAIRQLARVS
jgi:hypothetical protein